MKIDDRVKIKNLLYLFPYWRNREGKITSVHPGYVELDIGGYFTPFRESELEVIKKS